MVKAFVTIITAAGASRDVIGPLRDLDEVKHAHIVAGEFDIVAEVETGTERELLSLITEEIQTLPGVGRTSTCIILD